MAPSEQLPSVGALQLHLNGSTFLAGNELSGTVCLTLDTPVSDALITVQVNGLERLHWMYIARGEFTPSKHDQWMQHLRSEFFLGELNGTLAVGVHELPFTFTLPVDLLSNAAVRNVLRKQVDDYRHVHVDLEYDVVAKLEVAGLSNKSLTQKQRFTISPTPVVVPLGRPVKAEATDHIKVVGFGKGGPCTVRMVLASNVADVPKGTISVDVEVELPPKRKPHQVKVILFEDVNVDRGSTIPNGTRHVPRDICFVSYKPKQLEAVETPRGTTFRGTMQLVITDPDTDSFGALTPSLRSTFLQIRHRVGVECDFLIGPSVTAFAAITLVDRAPSAVPA